MFVGAIAVVAAVASVGISVVAASRVVVFVLRYGLIKIRGGGGRVGAGCWCGWLFGS